MRQNAHQVARLDRVILRWLASNLKRSGALLHVEDLLSIIMHVKWGSLAQFQHNNEGFRRLSFSAVHDQVVDVSGETVAGGIGSIKNKSGLSHRTSFSYSDCVVVIHLLLSNLFLMGRWRVRSTLALKYFSRTPR